MSEYVHENTDYDNNSETIPNFKIISSYDELFNKLYYINGKNLITISEYQIPISNQYYIMIIDNEKEKFNGFFKYIFDEQRETSINFELDTTLDSELSKNLAWDKEQFYFMNMEKSNIIELGRDLDKIKEIVDDSNGGLHIIIDINYLINFITKLKNSNIQAHLYDLIIHKLSNYTNLSNLIIFDDENKYQPTNLLFEQIKTRINNKYISSMADNIIIVYKQIKEDDYKLYWNKVNMSDISVKINQIENNDVFDNFYYGMVNNRESFICEIKINNILKNNIFELDTNPGIVLDTIDLINN
jgi:hypothetical protein